MLTHFIVFSIALENNGQQSPLRENSGSMPLIETKEVSLVLPRERKFVHHIFRLEDKLFCYLLVFQPREWTSTAKKTGPIVDGGSTSIQNQAQLAFCNSSWLSNSGPPYLHSVYK